MCDKNKLSIQAQDSMNHLENVVVFVSNHVSKEEKVTVLKNLVHFVNNHIDQIERETNQDESRKQKSAHPLKETVKKKETPAIKLANKMLTGEINDDIPYFRLNLKLISYYTIEEDGLRKGVVTGNMRPFARMIQKLGYVQVNASCTVSIRHVRYIDYDYIYLDTFEKVSIGDTYRELCKKQLWSLRKRYPDFGKDKAKYQLVTR